jgi:hypothetical protein
VLKNYWENQEMAQEKPETPAAPVKAPEDALETRVGTAGEQQRIRMNTASVKSSYCNMVNVTTTREEVVMNFGVNESWDRGAPSTTSGWSIAS